MASTSSLSFAELLRRHRLAVGLTQEGLAEQAGLSARGIQDLERGARTVPRAETVRMLADALGLDAAARAALIAAAQTGGGLSPPHPRPPTLPVPLTPLIGRQQEVAAVQRLLGDEEARLVTLTGPGGSGKTRLALAAVAGATNHYRDGVWFVDLAPITDPRLVAGSIADALGIRERGPADVADRLREQLRAWQALLVLDNCEQVLGATPLVMTLLSACPHLCVLATSREPLRVSGEREYPVQPLPLPEAVVLFVERARGIQPAFAASGELGPVVVEICARLDGLPLAIELAAARIRLLPPGAMLARLERRLSVVAGGTRDLPARQQTLRRTIDWSHDLLAPPEQQLFARLAVFVGGCTLAAIEAVGNADGALAEGVLEGVESLVAKHLLRQEEGADGEPRLLFLETIHEYACERLAASAEAGALRRAHAEYYLALAEASLPGLIGPEQGRWMARLLEDQDNLRAALGWARDHGESELWLRLAGALWRFWELRFQTHEGRAWLEGALAADRGAPPAVRARALNGVGNLTWMQADLVQAAAYQAESLALFRAAGDQLGTAWALNDLGNSTSDRGDHAGATVLYEESLVVAREIGADWMEACALHNLGTAAVAQAEYERASGLLAEALEWWRRLGDEVFRARSLSVAAQVAQQQGDSERALAYESESLTLRRRYGDRHGMAASHGYLGWIELERGEGQRARTNFRVALPLHHEAGNRRGMARCLTGLALLVAGQGQTEAAAQLLGTADAILHSEGAVLAPEDQRRYDRAVATVATALSSETLAAALTAGRALSPEQAVALALGERG